MSHAASHAAPPAAPPAARSPARPTPSAGRWAVAALCGFAALAAGMTLWWPLGFDQAIFSANGAKVLAGGLPYRDAFETRGPIVFYTFAGIHALLGRTAVAVRLFDLLALAAAGAVLWRLVRGIGSPRAAALAVALWTLYQVSWEYNDTAQPDTWVAYAVLAAAALCARPDGARARDLLVAGGVVGLCALSKPLYPVFLLAPWAAAAARDARPRAAVRAAMLLGAGCAAPVALALAAIRLAGFWEAFVDAHYRFTVQLYLPHDQLTLAQRLGRVALFPFTGLPKAPLVGAPLAVALPAAVAGGAALWRRGRRPLAAALVAMAAAGLFCLVLQGKFWLYQWSPVLLPVAVLAACGFAAAAGEAGDAGAPAGRAWSLASVTLLALVVAVRPAALTRRWASYVLGRTPEERYYAGFAEGWSINPADQRAAAAYLRAHTAPGAPIAVWPIDAAVPFLAGRPQVGRFPLTRVLDFDRASPLVQRFRVEYAEQLRAARPPYFVHGYYLEYVYHDPPPPIGTFLQPELGDFLARNYVLDRSFGSMDVFRRVDYVPPAGLGASRGPARPSAG